MVPIPDPKYLLIGAVSFLRIGGIIFSMPVFGDQPTPLPVRTLLAFALTLTIYPLFQSSWKDLFIPNDVWLLLTLISKELLIGLCLGFVSRLNFDGIIGAASTVASQMGFGSDRLFLPDLKSEVDGFTALHRMIVMIIFLTLGLHGIFINAIVESFRVIPPGGVQFTGAIAPLLIETTGNILSIAMQLAAPVLIALLFTTGALGLVSRAVPQLNAFSLSFPMSFLVGLLVYIATIPLFPTWTQIHFSQTNSEINAFLKALSP